MLNESPSQQQESQQSHNSAQQFSFFYSTSYIRSTQTHSLSSEKPKCNSSPSLSSPPASSLLQWPRPSKSAPSLQQATNGPLLNGSQAAVRRTAPILSTWKRHRTATFPNSRPNVRVPTTETSSAVRSYHLAKRSSLPPNSSLRLIHLSHPDLRRWAFNLRSLWNRVVFSWSIRARTTLFTIKVPLTITLPSMSLLLISLETREATSWSYVCTKRDTLHGTCFMAMRLDIHGGNALHIHLWLHSFTTTLIHDYTYLRLHSFTTTFVQRRTVK